MSRTLPAALATELDATELRPFYAIELLFDSGDLRFWTGYDEIEVNNEIWTGSGLVIGLSGTSEPADLSANGLTITFSALDSSIIAVMLGENYRGRSAKVYIGALDSTNQPVSDMYQVFAGRMDIMTLQENGNVATIAINVENVLIDLDRPRPIRLTSEDQLNRYSGDQSLSGVAQLQDRQISWGR